MFKKLKLSMLLAVFGFAASVAMAQSALPTSGEWSSQAISRDQIVNLTGNVTLTGKITISNGATLTINGYGYTIKRTNADAYFEVTGKNSSTQTTLEIKGTSNTNRMVLDGGAVFNTACDARSEFIDGINATNAMIHCSGALKMEHVYLQNCYYYYTTSPGVEPNPGNDKRGAAIVLYNQATVSSSKIRESTLSDVIIRGCYGYTGSAVNIDAQNYCAKLTMTDCEISKCKTYKEGGMIRTTGNVSTNITISGGKIEYNESVQSGGAILFNAGGTAGGTTAPTQFTLKDGTEICHNKAVSQGGAILNSSVMDLQSAKIHHNTAADGGGIYLTTYANKDILSVPWQVKVSQNVSIYNNTATNHGGGLYLSVSYSTQIKPMTDDGNTAKFKLELDGGQVYGNSAATGGAVFLYDTAPKVVKNSDNNNITFERYVNVLSGKLYNNHATQMGGAIDIRREKASGISYTEGGDLFVNINGGEIYGNVAGYGVATSVNNAHGGAFSIRNSMTDVNGTANVTIEQKNSQTIDIHDNQCKNFGGAIYVDGGNVTYKSGTMRENTTTDGNGGGFYVNNGNVEITGGTIKENVATTGHGGGFYSAGGTVNITKATISGNHADAGNGGGLYSAAAITVGGESGDGATISGNHAKNGAGFYVKAVAGATTIIQGGSEVSGNIATVNGAGAYIESGNLTVNSSNVKGNHADAGNGGGFYVNGGNLTLSGGSIGASGAANNALNGGGVYANGGNISITNGNIQYNTANVGAGFYLSETGIASVSGTSYIQNNVATTKGGGVYSKATGSGSTAGFTMNGGTLQSNKAVDGGAIYVDGGTLKLEGGNIGASEAANKATNGGGVYANGGTITIANGNIQYNTANVGAGFYVSETGIASVSGASSYIQNNVATTKGGGVYSKATGSGSTAGFTMNGGTLQSNDAVDGGAVYVDGGTLKLTGGSIGTLGNPNTATNGGGFYVQGGSATIDGGTVQYNTATNGAGLYMQGINTSNKATATFTNGMFSINTATTAGGGIYLSNYSQLTMSGTSTVTGNNAGSKGGGIVIDGCVNGDRTMTPTAECKIINSSSNAADLTVNGNTVNSLPNNVYLMDEEDYITIVPEHPENPNDLKLGHISVGISIDAIAFERKQYKKAINCGDYTELLNSINDMLKRPEQNNTLFDDARRYEPLISAEYPYDSRCLYFVKVWPCAVTDAELKDFAELEGLVREIPDAKTLAMFMMLVNGYRVVDGVEQYATNLQGVVTADIDMKDAGWLPIAGKKGTGLDKPFTGSFDGGGHVISNLHVDNGYALYDDFGLFGKTQGATIKNVVIDNCNFVSGEAQRMGALICDMKGGTVANCIASGVVDATGSETLENKDGIANNEYFCVVGGLIGEVSTYEDHAAPIVVNCMSTVKVGAEPKPDDLTAMYPRSQKITAGGLIGMTSAETKVENCYAHAQIKHKCKTSADFTGYHDATSQARFVGGLVGVNKGTITNCYVRFQNGTSLDITGEHPTSKFGMFAGDNTTGTVRHCYAPAAFTTCHNYFYNVSTMPANCGDFDAPVRPYTYTSYLVDNQVKMAGESYGTTEATTLVSKLNGWVNGPKAGETVYSHWMRTEGSPVNGDYPLLSYDNTSAPDYAVVGSKDGIDLDYNGSFTNVYNRLEPGMKGCLFVYAAPWTTDAGDNKVSDVITADNTATGNTISVYVDENVALLQDETSALEDVYTCQVLKNTGFAARWHNIATSLSGDKIGFKYGITTEVKWNEDQNPCNVTLAVGESSIFPTGTPVLGIDLYFFYEPQYHWLNLKRNHLSHWHMNKHDANIAYSGDDNYKNDGSCTLVPGKGYLAAIDKDMLLQGNGTLNNGSVTIPVTVEAGTHNEEQGIPYAGDGTELKGYNLLGNPYQSYLDFARFANVNSSLWESSTPSYAVFDAASGYYVQGTAAPVSKGSFAAQGDINMHQGFFIVADKAGDAKFDNTMRSDKPLAGTHFRGEDLAYPLVNLVVTDASGQGDVAVVEFDRPEYLSATKMKSIGADGKVYFRHNGDDHALLFLDEPAEQLTVCFEAIAEGSYTMTWSTANADFSYLHLIDNMTGADTDMLASDGYTFNASLGDYKTRFKMVFAYTGIDEEASTEADETFAFMHDGNLTVGGEGWLEVIDMTGRIVASTRLSGTQNTVSLPQAAQGLYVLRLTNDSKTKVQKIVIR